MFRRPTLQIRTMRPTDVAAVRRLEYLCFGTNRGTDEDLEEFLDHPATGAVVAYLGRQLAGYLLYQIKLEDGHVKLCHIAVDPEHRRTAVATRMVNALRYSVSALTNLGLSASVSERNLECHLFLRKNGFKAVRVLRGALADGRDDAYLFTCPCGVPAAAHAVPV